MVEAIEHLFSHERLTCFQSCDGRGDGGELSVEPVSLASERDQMLRQRFDRIVSPIEHLGDRRQ